MGITLTRAGDFEDCKGGRIQRCQVVLRARHRPIVPLLTQCTALCAEQGGRVYEARVRACMPVVDVAAANALGCAYDACIRVRHFNHSGALCNRIMYTIYTPEFDVLLIRIRVRSS